MPTLVIAHISDLHFTSSYFSRELWENVRGYINRLRPDVVVVTGDITDNGHVHEYRVAVERLSEIEASRMLVVPGNHDARNMGYLVFEEVFGDRFPLLEYQGVCIQGVDSSEPDIDDGHIGRLAYDLITRNLSGCSGLKIVALHHHLIPVPGTGRERNIPIDAGDFLKLLIDLRVNMVLSGHKHVPWLWVLNGMVLVHAGTASTLRLKAGIPPSFNVIEVDGMHVRVTRVNSKTLRERVIYEGVPSVQPVTLPVDHELMHEVLEAAGSLRARLAGVGRGGEARGRG